MEDQVHNGLESYARTKTTHNFDVILIIDEDFSTEYVNATHI
jgi:hypothetical protein